MAIGDAVAVFLGTGATTRTLAAGVEEQISCILKAGSTDNITMEDGSNSVEILAAATVTNAGTTNTYNMALMTDENMEVRKNGTTDRVYFGGVQTNA